MSQRACRIEQTLGRIELHAPAFTYVVDPGAGLRGITWINHLAGRTVDLGGGLEFEATLDRAKQRIGITGWRGIASASRSSNPDEDPGFQGGYHLPSYDDRNWIGMLSPADHRWPTDSTTTEHSAWVRTHVFLPADGSTHPLTLFLGGWGLFDFRSMRVFVNGQCVGTREATTRWHAPGAFTLEPETEPYMHLRWEQDNVIALQLRGQITRTTRLDEVDPLHGREFYAAVWPPQFEQQIVIGTSDSTPTWSVIDTQVVREGEDAIWHCTLATPDHGLQALVAYSWNVSAPILHKHVTFTNIGSRTERILMLRLGQYTTDTSVSEGEQGFPVYLDDAAWIGLAHPSGWVTGQDRSIELRHYPAAWLEPGGTPCRSMEFVCGVAPSGSARSSFLEHLRGRMRRTARGHDRVYAIFEGLGSWDYDPETATGIFADVVSTEASDARLLPNLRAMVAGADAAGYHFDIYSLEMWVDNTGDLIRFAPDRFPDGLANINAELAKVGTAPGLWIDSSMAAWSIGENPVVASTFTHDTAYGCARPTLCRATDPIRTMYRTAFLHHIAANGVRLLKTDNLTALCYNPDHPHLPGIYSTEAIQNAVIETLQQWDAACPELLLMLYWGYRSPWWLLYGDTIFEPGLFIEAAHPGSSPTLFIRDSVIQGLDQAQAWAVDVPALGKDSLGVWLSHWKWNSSIGSERWQEAFIMDMCRGSLLAQPWSDGPWLDAPQRRQIAAFITLLRSQSACFGNPRFIFGDPWHNEPYGYCCTDGNRAFIAINNCAWTDGMFVLELNSTWGLPDDGDWDLYRHYPDPARLMFKPGTSQIMLRPFQIVLLEVVAAGTAPTSGCGQTFEHHPLPDAFPEATLHLPTTLCAGNDDALLPVPCEQDRRIVQSGTKRLLRVAGNLPATASGGLLAVTAELRRDNASVVTDDIGKYFAVHAEIEDQIVTTTPVVRERTYAAPWQAWRIAVPPCPTVRSWALAITMLLPDDVELVCGATFIPN